MLITLGCGISLTGNAGRSPKAFRTWDSKFTIPGSAFYLWARIPERFNDAIAFNEMLMRDAGVGMTPGSAFADSDAWDAFVRICIAREDAILEGSMEKLQRVLR